MRKKFLFTLVASLAVISTSIAADSLKVVFPVTRIVFQRDNNNNAAVQIKGTYPAKATLIEARLVPRSNDQGKSTPWVSLRGSSPGQDFTGHITAQAGWYDLEVRAKHKKKKIASAKIERIGIGEVFIVVGHSVAQGGEINIEGADDDRVSLVAANNKTDVFDNFYLKTGDPKYLPEVAFAQAASGIAPAPFGHNTYFWSKFGEYVVKETNVPVLIFNAAFGGTSLEHWAKSAQNIQFEHGFVRSAIRMPYINLYNTLAKYIPVTGIRAVLADQGQNDAGQKSSDTILMNYKIFMQQARKDLQYPELAVVVNRQTPANSPQVRKVQEQMLKEPFSFPGPDYDKVMLPEDRYDGIHLSESGLRKAALSWAEALTPRFFAESKPWLPPVK